jgi:hypothetical protein
METKSVIQELIHYFCHDYLAFRNDRPHALRNRVGYVTLLNILNFVAFRLHEVVRSLGLKLLIEMEQQVVRMFIIIGVNIGVMLGKLVKERLARINGWQARQVIWITRVYE